MTTLEDLKHVWQQKLSDLKIAHFPWDPPATEDAQGNAAAAQARAAQQPQPQHLQHQQQMSHQHMQQGQPQIKSEPGVSHYPQLPQNGGVKVKTEPGLESQNMYGLSQQPNLAGNPTHDPQLAAMRAQQNIAQKFGTLQGRPAPGLVLPGMNPGPPPQHQRPTNGPHHNGIPQHDGADYFDDAMIPVEGYGLLTREQADNILLRRIGMAERQGAKAAEELSLALLSLKGGKKGKGSARVRQLDAYEEAHNPNSSYPYPSGPYLGEALSSAPQVSQLDGDDESEIDEDAINSDLDDPEEDEIDNDDDDEVPQIMLCMYDKVQRTKNKWKCVLKDGVLTINGREYVFHKANGEYEW